ncbi:flagellin protein FlaA [Yersinia bercovieri]|nr:flagellin protein FlaA [Yersinia bercovieri]
MANGKSERAAYQEEFSSLGQQLERVFTNTTFNGEKLLAKDGKLDGKLVFQTGTQNSTPMEANFSKQLKNLMDGISAKGTKSLAAGTNGSIEKKYYDALKKVVLAEEKYRAIDALVDQEVRAAAAVAGLGATPLDQNSFSSNMRSVFTATSSVALSGLGNFTAATVKGDDAELDTNASFAAQTHAANDFNTTAAKAATVIAIKGLAAGVKGELTTAKDELDSVMDDPDFDLGGALNLKITDNKKSQQATVALEKLALEFDEMNSQVQALMDSMQAQSEMQSTVINKTEEAIGATRDTDYMEETSNIAAAKLRNVTAMAAVKQSYEITSTIINTLVNVNN